MWHCTSSHEIIHSVFCIHIEPTINCPETFTGTPSVGSFDVSIDTEMFALLQRL